MSDVLRIKIARVDRGLGDIPLPQYITEGSAGMDLCAAVDGDQVVKPGEVLVVPTGFGVELPHGYEAQVRPRSGLAAKHGLGILNTPGTIDPDYRGEIKVILTNFGKQDFVVHRGDRIAQLVINRYVRIQWEEVERLTDSTRGSGGLGHTGMKGL
ncbi:MAG: dUTP diphosphatase [Bacteroidota bacterium]